MSNIAGKAYAMNVITPINQKDTWLNRIIFLAAGVFPPYPPQPPEKWLRRFVFWAATKLLPDVTLGLRTLSLIHYARWVIVTPDQFPMLGAPQQKEELKYNYMFFFSNFNGSWDQYVDSFSSAISGGLNLFWKRNVKYPGSVPMLPFHHYITSNQIWTDYYYNAYPMASSNDVKSAKVLKARLLEFVHSGAQNASPEEFQQAYNHMLFDLQHQLSCMDDTPVVSLSAAEVQDRFKKELRPR